MSTNVESHESASAQPGKQPIAGHAAPFVVLWFVWAALLLGAMFVGNFASHSSGLATALRMASSVALVVTGWTAWGLWRRSEVGMFALLVAVGMTLGTVGDFFNAGLLDFIPLPDPVLGGIAAFGLGHIAYIAGCFNLARRAGLTCPRALAAGVIAWQLVGVVGWYFVAMQGTEGRALVWPALPYSLLLAGTAGVTSGLALQERRLAGLALGAALFLASDLILAFGLFRGSFAHQTECVWMTYGPGQMLIVFSTLSAALVLAHRRAS